jgi:hypothetical protein
LKTPSKIASASVSESFSTNPVGLKSMVLSLDVSFSIFAILLLNRGPALAAALPPGSGVVQFPDGDGARITGLQTKLAQNTFIQVFFHHCRLVAVLLKNGDGANSDTPPASSDADAGGHIHIHSNELA